METSALVKELKANLEDRGFSVTTCPSARLDDLKQDLEAPRKEGLIGEDFFKENLSGFKLSPRDYPAGMQTIILTAFPQPSQEAAFRYRGQEYRYPVPPTYDTHTDNIAEKIITDIIKPRGFGLFPAWIPVKLAAVRTGLAKYGRNNITYRDDTGSYHRLKAFITDLPTDETPWHELELMPQCDNCQACLQSCPTGAIGADRILLHAAKCLTYLNERPEPFPAWVERSWHHALIGCLRCQLACPIDKDKNIHPDSTVNFTEEETKKLLNAGDKQDLPGSVTAKLDIFSLGEDWQLIARNLKVMLA